MSRRAGRPALSRGGLCSSDTGSVDTVRRTTPAAAAAAPVTDTSVGSAPNADRDATWRPQSPPPLASASHCVTFSGSDEPAPGLCCLPPGDGSVQPGGSLGPARHPHQFGDVTLTSPRRRGAVVTAAVASFTAPRAVATLSLNRITNDCTRPAHGARQPAKQYTSGRRAGRRPSVYELVDGAASAGSEEEEEEGPAAEEGPAPSSPSASSSSSSFSISSRASLTA